MGLDNGILVKGKTKEAKEFLNNNYKYLFDSAYNDNDTYEFGYWRKCWNIRQRFLDTFSEKYDEYEIRFNKDDLYTVINTVLKYFLVENNWEYNDSYSQVFSWIEELPSIANAIRNLYFLIEDIENGEVNEEELEIYFYDSY